MPDVIFEKRVNGVALITLNRPDSLNAMGGDLMPLLAQHLDESRWDNTVRCVVLTGAGRAFCAGGDVKNMAAQGGRESDGKRSPAASFAYGVDELRESQRRTSYTLHTMPKPTMAVASTIASGPALAYASMKENLNRAETSDLLTLLEQEALNMRLSGTTQDHREAARAFVEKRTPIFSGQ